MTDQKIPPWAAEIIKNQQNGHKLRFGSNTPVAISLSALVALISGIASAFASYQLTSYRVENNAQKLEKIASLVEHISREQVKIRTELDVTIRDVARGMQRNGG